MRLDFEDELILVRGSEREGSNQANPALVNEKEKRKKKKREKEQEKRDENGRTNFPSAAKRLVAFDITAHLDLLFNDSQEERSCFALLY